MSEQISKKYEDLKTKNSLTKVESEAHLKNLAKVQEEVNKWTKFSQQISKQRAKRNSAFPIPGSPSLKREERESLQKLFSIYGELKEAQKDFSNQLKSFVNSHLPPQFPSLAAQLSSAPDFKSITESLQAISFDSELKTGKSLNSGRNANWNQHPYKHFYNSKQDYEKSVSSQENVFSSIQKQQEKIKRELGGRWYSRTIQRALQQQQAIYNKWTSGSSSNIELQIAQKLLGWMGKLNTPTPLPQS